MSMRLSIAILALAFQQQCHFTQDIARQAEQGLTPYFPHARTTVSNGTLISYTCADLGIKAIQELPATLDKNPQVQQLKQMNLIVGLAGVRAFALGFPDAILVLNLATKQYQIVPTAGDSIYTRD